MCRPHDYVRNGLRSLFRGQHVKKSRWAGDLASSARTVVAPYLSILPTGTHLLEGIPGHLYEPGETEPTFYASGGILRAIQRPSVGIYRTRDRSH